MAYRGSRSLFCLEPWQLDCGGVEHSEDPYLLADKEGKLPGDSINQTLLSHHNVVWRC